MTARWSWLLLAIAVSGCTQVIDTPPKPRTPVAPITAGQVSDLLSSKVEKYDGNLFSTVEPEKCAGVAKEVDPPFIFDLDPAATDGGHWMAEGVGHPVYMEEMVGVYPADYDAKNALAQAKRTLESCVDVPFTVTDMKGRSYDFTLLPLQASSSPNILLWSFTASDWACDSTFVAAHNAAIEISTCAAVGGYPVDTLATEALNRIETLANTTA
ncbi:sensor domain-containing protein [Mycobacterium sp. NPDC051804]|uniref:sensor domain-containing protein n=1 Tax=Mycobacterium sp. NPDC051804 TaxID=3364295 RepID=UPI003799286B